MLLTVAGSSKRVVASMVGIVALWHCRHGTPVQPKCYICGDSWIHKWHYETLWNHQSTRKALFCLQNAKPMGGAVIVPFSTAPIIQIIHARLSVPNMAAHLFLPKDWKYIESQVTLHLGDFAKLPQQQAALHDNWAYRSHPDGGS